MGYSCDYCGEHVNTPQEKAAHMRNCDDRPADAGSTSGGTGGVADERVNMYTTASVFGTAPEEHPSRCDHGAAPPDSPRPTAFEEREVTIKTDPEETLTVWKCERCFVLRFEDPFASVEV